jgi:hypothetical protein
MAKKRARPTADEPKPASNEQQKAATELLAKIRWHKEQAARFANGDPADPHLALAALRYWRERPAIARDYKQLEGCPGLGPLLVDKDGVVLDTPPGEWGGFYGPVRLDKWNVIRAKSAAEAEREHFRSAVRLVVAFAQRHKIDAAPLLTGNDNELVLRVEAAIQAELQAHASKPPAATEKLPVDDEVAWPVMLSAPDLARRLRLSDDRVESALRRFRKKHPDCCEEVENPRKNQPRYLYRTADVLPILERRVKDD